MSRDNVDVRVDDGDEGLIQVSIGEANSFEQRAVGSTLNAALNQITSHDHHLIKTKTAFVIRLLSWVDTIWIEGSWMGVGMALPRFIIAEAC